MNHRTDMARGGRLASVPREYTRPAFHCLKDAEPIASDNTAWRLMCELGSEALLEAMLRYYRRHHPSQPLGLAIAGCEADRARHAR